MKKFFLALVAMTALTVSTASATPVGTFAFGGGVQTVVAPGNSFTLLTNINPDTTAYGTLSNTGSGDFATGSPRFMYIVGALGSPFTFTNVNVSSGVTLNFGAQGGPVEWSFTSNGFLGSSLVVGPFGPSNAASATLTGIFTKGNDTEVGTIAFSFQNTVPPPTGDATASTAANSYSADASTVPEPSTYAMLGTALLGLGLLRRRK
jgi:hypothetical protein